MLIQYKKIIIKFAFPKTKDKIEIIWANSSWISKIGILDLRANWKWLIW